MQSCMEFCHLFCKYPIKLEKLVINTLKANVKQIEFIHKYHLLYSVSSFPHEMEHLILALKENKHYLRRGDKSSDLFCTYSISKLLYLS